jgi:hypothetical protein
MALKELRTIVIGLGAMNESNLREVRRRVKAMGGHSQAQDLVVNLIDLYLKVGTDTTARARAAASCLMALDKIEEGG